jgi:hypothetical protein
MPLASSEETKRRFRHCFAVDEIYFHSLVHGSPWSAHTQFGLEQRGDRWTSEIFNFHYIHPSLGVWLDGSYAAEITASRLFFARKVRSAQLDDLLGALRRTTGIEDLKAGIRRDGQVPLDGFAPNHPLNTAAPPESG